MIIRNHYSDELKREIIALALNGHSVASLAQQFEPTAATIHAWVREARAQDELDPALSDAARIKELEAKARELQMDFEILKRANFWFAMDRNSKHQ